MANSPAAASVGGRFKPSSVARSAEEVGPSLASGILSSLVRRAGDGDAAAFATVYTALHGEVYERVLARLHDPGQAAEVTSGTLVEVWRLARFHAASGDDVREWVRCVADVRLREYLELPSADGRSVPDVADADRWWAAFRDAHHRCREQDLAALTIYPT